MASHNRVILLGNLTRDIELRHTPGGLAVTEMGIAVNDRRKNANGEWVEEVTYVDITLFGRSAEVANEFLRKGSQVFVEGRLKLDSWEADGQKKYKLRVIGEKMQLLGSRGGDAERGGGGRTSSGFSGRQAVSSSNDEYSSDSSSHDDDYTPPGRRDAQPTGNGPGYQDEDIPF
jgi:single-strand DNA-binding protein